MTGEERRSTHKYRCTVVNCDIIEASNSLDCINKMLTFTIFTSLKNIDPEQITIIVKMALLQASIQRITESAVM